MTAELITSNTGFSRRLFRTRLATRFAIVAERFWPLVLPLLVVLLLFVSASWFGLFRILPDIARIGLAVVFALAALAALYPLRYFRQPTQPEIDRRIEGANQLAHTPVLVQTDSLGSKPDVFADALWREHQNRMAEKLRNVTGDTPRARVPERDPWGLRAVAPLLALTALAFSYGPSGGRISDALSAHVSLSAVPPRIDAWVTPPAYTGKPPIFLTAENNRDVASFTVPTGSDVTVRVTGGSGDETLAFADAAGMVRTIEPAGETKDAAASTEAAAVTMPRQFTGKLATNGVLSLTSGSTEIDKWAFSIIGDTPPTIRFSSEPKRAVNGSLELHYEIKDDYGAASAVGEISLAEPQQPKARPLYPAPELPLTLPRRNATPPVAKTTRDLTEHVWAGARVKLTLQTADAAKQEARSDTRTFTLPERTFTNPLAKALVEQRRLLGIDANKRPWVLTLMDAITLRPEDTFDAMSHYIAIMSARTRLKMAQSDDELRGVADYMWEIALGIENGELSEAEKRLRQAREALKEALERGASDEEIDKLMKELRQAMAEFLREFAERQRNNKNLPELPPDTQMLTDQDLQKLLDKLEEMAKSGDKQSAQELLSQLEQMMQNLQAGRQGQQGQNGQQSEMRKQMNKLGEIMRRQQEMMNETFRTERGQRGQGNEEQGQEGEQGEAQNGEPQPGQNGQPMTPEEFAEAMKQLQDGQGKLQQELDALQKGLRGLGIQPGEGFGEAGRQMGQAEGALGDQQGERATGHQGRALESLRKGAQDMMQQMQQAMQGDEGGSETGGRQPGMSRDPLNRPSYTQGWDTFENGNIDNVDIQRARRILEAIRKRLGNALSPELERNYLERLLKME